MYSMDDLPNLTVVIFQFAKCFPLAKAMFQKQVLLSHFPTGDVHKSLPQAILAIVTEWGD